MGKGPLSNEISVKTNQHVNTFFVFLVKKPESQCIFVDLPLATGLKKIKSKPIEGDPKILSKILCKIFPFVIFLKTSKSLTPFQKSPLSSYNTSLSDLPEKIPSLYGSFISLISYNFLKTSFLANSTSFEPTTFFKNKYPSL